MLNLIGTRVGGGVGGGGGMGVGVAVGAGVVHIANNSRSLSNITSAESKSGETPSGKSPAQVKKSTSQRAVTLTTVPSLYVWSSLDGMAFIRPKPEGKMVTSRRKRRNEVSAAPAIGLSSSVAFGVGARTGTASGTGTCTKGGSPFVGDASPVFVGPMG